MITYRRREHLGTPTGRELQEPVYDVRKTVEMKQPHGGCTFYPKSLHGGPGGRASERRAA